MSMVAALAYAALALPPIAVQCGLAGGAAWGVLTLGGAWPGRLPILLRFVAVIQAALLIAMSLVVLSRGGVIAYDAPSWSYPTAMVVTALSVVSNTITPSKPERRLWMPVTAGMLVTGLLAGLS